MDNQKLCLVLLMTCFVLAHVEGDLNEPNVQVSGKTDNFCIWFGTKSINALITYIEFLQCLLFYFSFENIFLA